MFSPKLEPIDLALLLTAVPLATGFLVAWVLRMLRGGRSPGLLATIVVLLASPILLALIAPTVRLGIWDGAWLGLFAGLGMVAGLLGWQDYPVEVLLGVASLTIALGVAEFLARTALPAPPGFPAVEAARLFLPEIDLDDPEPARGDFTEPHRAAIDGCAMLYPERYPVYVEERSARDGSAAGSVVYLGDSMTYGLGVGLQQAFPALLEQRTPDLFHFNLAFPGTGTDYHYVVARHWIPLLRPPVRLVVIGLYFNDILEIGQGMSCCRNRSVVGFESGAPVERCPEPAWVPGYGESIGWFLVHSPPPYPLRVAMQYSYLARWVGAMMGQSAAQAVHSDRPSGEQAVWDQMAEILVSLRDELAQRHIPLIAVLLPIRSALEADDPTRLDSYEQGRRVKELTESLRIRTLDPSDHLRALVQRHGSSRYFLGGDDIHLNQEGHAVMAQWLAENVPELSGAGVEKPNDRQGMEFPG